MCGIAGVYSLTETVVGELSRKLMIMNKLQSHRGPDGDGLWCHTDKVVGFAHRRLSIIDLQTGDQPMRDERGNWVVYNGEIYNYLELRKELGENNFRTTSDTEVILQSYQKWGEDCLSHFHGMFAFALWDESKHKLFCARDRFGIKPFYYMVMDAKFYFASEIKALLPFVPGIETDMDGLKDYLTFQFCLDGKTLFKNIQELKPGHYLTIHNQHIQNRQYWEVYFHLDQDHTENYFENKLREVIETSVDFHMRSDVPVGAYVSGGLDSSAVAYLGSRISPLPFMGFSGKFSLGTEYDESMYARCLAEYADFPLQEIDISPLDFIENIRKVIYHLDYPVAGPGSFSQYMVSRLAAKYRKVVLGGQGGDEIFGGYTRYLIAYFEQCIKAAIDGTMHNGNFIVTYESIIPNLSSLRNYKPMLKEFWSDGLFDEMDSRYFKLINRAPNLEEEVNWDLLGSYTPYETFKSIFHGDNVRKDSYFDLMTNFDFKTLLPALLQVEDRMSMAHGLESRVPLLDHPIVELAASIPANIKFKKGSMKHIFKQAMKPYIPEEIYLRKDKMGFPTPFIEYAKGVANEFILDIFNSNAAQNRTIIDNRKVIKGLESEPKFSRKLWGLLSLEIWQQEFHDRGFEYRKMVA